MTQTTVRIEADNGVSSSRPLLVVELRHSDDDRAARNLVQQVATLGSATFPQTVAVVPRRNDASRLFELHVTATSGDRTWDARVVSGFVQNERRTVVLRLEDACLGVVCPSEFTCRSGDCVSPWVDPSGRTDASFGTQSDAFVSDLTDAFRGIDASVVIVDAGTDAGTDVTLDASMMSTDAGTDVSLDAFSAFDATRDAFSPDAFSPDAYVPPDAFTPDALNLPDAFTAGDSGIGCVGATCAGVVLISELSTGGATTSDEFVEFHNTSNRMADISNMRVYYASDSGGTVTLRATLAPGTLLSPGQFYLIASASFVGSPDLRSSTSWPTSFGISSGGGTLTLEAPARGVVDRVCWGTGTLCEGASVTPVHGTNGSYERKANASSTDASMSSGADATAGNRYDMGNNRTDFIVRTTRNPQGLTSPLEP